MAWKKKRRAHKITHPVLGPATWPEMWAFAERVRATGKKICTWCHGEIAPNRRSRCGSRQCFSFIWQATSWSRCRKLALRRDPWCQCGARAVEVDHVVPVSLGGLSDQSNLRGLCRACHRAATSRLSREGKNYVAARKT